METKAQKAAERIRKVTWDYIREHGVLHIEDDTENEDVYVDENILANEYEFDAEGARI